jgi:hypothetical protein
MLRILLFLRGCCSETEVSEQLYFIRGENIMEKKALWGIPVLVLVFGLALVACPTESPEPGPGGEPGASETPFPVFSITNLPDPAFWNAMGSFENVPDVFQFADGHRVSTPSEWPARRAEVEKIIQHYEHGYMPPDTLTLTFVDTGTPDPGETLTTVLTLVNGGNTETITFGARLPNVPMPAGGYPAIILNTSSSNPNPSANRRAILDGAGYAIIHYNVNAIASESQDADPALSHGGVVRRLFNYNYATDLDAPSIFMSHAWGLGRLMDALEAGAFQGKINVNKLTVTGTSRWGKAAFIEGAFARSKTGKQIAVTNPVSAGSGGPNLERFISAVGMNYPDVTLGDPSTYHGKPLYLKPELVPDDHIDGKYGVNGPPDTVLKIAVLEGTDGVDVVYDGWGAQGGTNEWGGIETLPCVWSFHCWGNPRFWLFEDLKSYLDTDHNEGRSLYGYMDHLPWDQNFISSLVAPRALLVHEGYRTYRGNPEGQFACWLATDEVYKFLEAETYNGIKFYSITHSNPDYEWMDLVDFSDAYYAGTTPNAKYRNFEAFPINDPRSVDDYLKINWARPGGKSVAAQLREMLEEEE